MQVGNEPDLYADHGHRPSTYGPFDYFGEFSTLVNALQADPSAYPVRNNLIGEPFLRVACVGAVVCERRIGAWKRSLSMFFFRL
jgi:hypothetical protein